MALCPGLVRAGRLGGLALCLCAGAAACGRSHDAPHAERGRDGQEARLPAGGGPAAPAAPAVESAAPKARALASTDAVLDFPPFRGGERAITSERGLVVAVEAQAARAGARVLEDGGNAVDAAVTTLFVLAVTHPSAASLGGGGFALVRPPGKTTTAVDFVPVAPSALTRPAFERMLQGGARGPDAVGVPGFVAGLALLHQSFGKKPWKSLVEPALELARAGQILGPYPAHLIARNFAALKLEPSALKVFAERGQPRNAGTRWVQSELAWVLEQIAQRGRDGFYRGQVAERLARALAPNGPSVADFATYQALERDPLRFAYAGFTVETMPPPSAGGVALAGTLLAAAAVDPRPKPGSLDAVHALLEAERRAQAERRFGVVDPDSLAPSELSQRRARWEDSSFWAKHPITAQATPSGEVDPRFATIPRESEHTTHVSIVDRDGMAVSLTTTLCASFGARFVAAGTGIVLNNAVATFSSVGENQPVAGRRTTSSMAPTLLRSGPELRAILGTPGGDTIPSTLAQLVRHLVDEGEPLDRAVEAPRWHHGFFPDEARYEPKLAAESVLLAGLRARGHRLRSLGHRVGDANCIVLSGPQSSAYADSREPGVAIAAGR